MFLERLILFIVHRGSKNISKTLGNLNFGKVLIYLNKMKISKANSVKYIKEKIIPLLLGIFIGIFIQSSSFSINKIIENKFFNPIKIFSIDKVLEYFPLKEGNMWEYEGYIKRQKPNIEDPNPPRQNYKIIEKVIDKEEISDRILFTIERKEYIDGILDSSYQYGYFVVSNKVYKVNESDFKKIRVVLENFGLPFSNNLSNGYYDAVEDLDQNKLESFYEFPLNKGLLYGSMLSLVRNDHKYAKYVEGAIGYKSDIVKDKDCFEIVNNYTCCNSYQIFCKGLGVVEEEYVHNGAIDEYKVNLSKYLIKN